MANGIFDEQDETRQDNAENCAEARVANLHRALRSLLDSYKDMAFTCNQEPLFGEDSNITKAEAALFQNRPLADYETKI